MLVYVATEIGDRFIGTVGDVLDCSKRSRLVLGDVVCDIVASMLDDPDDKPVTIQIEFR